MPINPEQHTAARCRVDLNESAVEDDKEDDTQVFQSSISQLKHR